MIRDNSHLLEDNFNNIFFTYEDPVKKIFSYLCPYGKDLFYECPTGLETVARVSKQFQSIALEAEKDWIRVRNQWLQVEFVPLKKYGIITSEQACKFVKQNGFTKINLKGFDYFYYLCIKKLAKTTFEVTALSLARTELNTINAFIIAERFKLLTHINLSRTEINTDLVLLKFIECCPELESIKCSHTNISDESLEEVSRLKSQVKVLKLSNTEITDNGLITLVNGCTELEELYVADNELSTECASEILRKCSKLKKLDFGFNVDADGDIILENVKNHTSLTMLDLTHTETTDEGLKLHATGTSKLTEIYLSHNNVTNTSVLPFLKNQPHLTTVDLSYTNVDGNTIIKELENQKFLTNLNLTDTGVLSENLINLAKVNFNLKRIRALDCYLSYEEIVEVATLCPKLERFHFIKHYINNEQLFQFRAQFPHCEIYL